MGGRRHPPGLCGTAFPYELNEEFISRASRAGLEVEVGNGTTSVLQQTHEVSGQGGFPGERGFHLESISRRPPHAQLWDAGIITLIPGALPARRPT